MAGRSVQLVIQVLSETQKAAQGIQVFGRQLDTGLIAKGAAVAGVIGLATTAIIDMTSAAAADAAEQDRLMQAYQNAGAATGDYTTAINEAIAAGQEKAFTDTEIRNALVPLINVTGDAQKANESLALAQDVARMSGVDLETAAKAVAKAEAGQGAALAKLTQQTTKGQTATDILTEAQKRAAGQAEAYGNTTAGQAQSMSIAFDELTEMIGSFFLPILAEILPVLKPILKQFGELIQSLLPVLIPLVKLLIIPLKILVKVIGFIADVLVRLITWLSKAIEKVGDFLESLGPVRAVGDFIGGIFGGGSGRAMTPAAAAGVLGARATPAAAGSPMPSAMSGGATVRLKADVTHHIDDPAGALATVPGGARAIADYLNRGAEASGLYRQLQHAAGVR